jgi:hypothetical protein
MFAFSLPPGLRQPLRRYTGGGSSSCDRHGLRSRQGTACGSTCHGRPVGSTPDGNPPTYERPAPGAPYGLAHASACVRAAKAFLRNEAADQRARNSVRRGVSASVWL